MSGDSNLLLFPGCDTRGWITDALTGGAQRYQQHDADNIFFAWLLELPLGMDSKSAATSLLQLAEVNQPDDPFCNRLLELLRDLLDDRSQATAETLDELLQELVEENKNEEESCDTH